MSYELYLNDNDGHTCQVTPHQEGGTACIMTKTTNPATGKETITLGTADANLNITFNYNKHFPFRDLHGVRAGTAIPWLRHIVEMYGTERHVSDPPDPNDYWQSTKGNVGYCLSIILEWCKQHPDSRISVY
jgi:hypothetical protein